MIKFAILIKKKLLKMFMLKREKNEKNGKTFFSLFLFETLFNHRLINYK